MIDLTPLDVRKKRGDFGKGLRGYDPGEVDTFLDLVAERLEELVKENLTLRERVDRLSEQVNSQESRERAVHEALVTAQELREDVRAQAQRESDLIRKEAEGEARRIIREAEARVVERRQALEELERRRIRFIRTYRAMLERELDGVEVEEARPPLEEVEVELDLQGGRRGSGEGRSSEEASGAADPVHELAAAAEEGWMERDAVLGEATGGGEGADEGASGDRRTEAPPAGPRRLTTRERISPEDIWSGETPGSGGEEGRSGEA